jgi:hypothetical protein
LPLPLSEETGSRSWYDDEHTAQQRWRQPPASKRLIHVSTPLQRVNIHVNHRDERSGLSVAIDQSYRVNEPGLNEDSGGAGPVVTAVPVT